MFKLLQIIFNKDVFLRLKPSYQDKIVLID